MNASTVNPGRTATGRTVGSCGECGAGIATDGAAADTVTKCPQCGARVRLSMVYGERSSIPCDGRCMGAVGPSCSCACGGDNHGGWNMRIELVPVWDRDRARAAQERRRAEHAARRQAKADRITAARDDLIAAYPDLAALLSDRYAADFDFMGDMRAALQRGEMTPGQIRHAVAAVERDRRRDAEQAERDAGDTAALAAGVTVPAGKLTFTGTVLTVKYQDGYMPGRGGHKMLVQHADGWKVWGSVPGALEPEDRTGIGWEKWRQGMRGQVVTITATVEPSDNDPLFGFFKRPTVGDPKPATGGTARKPRTARKPAASAAPAVAPAPVAAPSPAPAPASPWAALLATR
jgi:DNA-directed RNA polymerase subunit RPC12/RpoP